MKMEQQIDRLHMKIVIQTPEWSEGFEPDEAGFVAQVVTFPPRKATSPVLPFRCSRSTDQATLSLPEEQQIACVVRLQQLFDT